MIGRLVRLVLLKHGAGLRHFVKSLRKPRRLFGVLTTAFFLSMFVWTSWRWTGRTGLSRDGGTVLVGMMFVMSLVGGFTQQGPRFMPSDVDFLFPAPFSPRHLILWRLLQTWPMLLLGSGFMVLMFATRVAAPLRFYVGIALLQMTMTHVQMLVSVLMTRAGDTMAKRLRGVSRLATTLILFAGILYMVFTIAEKGGLSQFIAPAAQSPVARILLFPATACVDYVYGETAATTSFALLRLVLCAAATFGLLMLPDIDFREESVATTERVARLISAKRKLGAVIDLQEMRRVRSGAIPATRILFRASGAIVWKNLILLLRSWRAIVPSLLFGLLLVLPTVLALRKSGMMANSAGQAMFPLLMLTLFTSGAFSFDLRRDADRLDQLRMLPLRPSGVVLAELILPWSIVVLLQETLLGTIAWLDRQRGVDVELLGYVAIALPLITFSMLVVDNVAVFFVAPKSGAAGARSGSGTSAAAQLLRVLVLLVGVGPALGALFGMIACGIRPIWAVATAVAIEVAVAIGLFCMLVHFYVTREIETGE